MLRIFSMKEKLIEVGKHAAISLFGPYGHGNLTITSGNISVMVDQVYNYANERHGIEASVTHSFLVTETRTEKRRDRSEG